MLRAFYFKEIAIKESNCHAIPELAERNSKGCLRKAFGDEVREGVDSSEIEFRFFGEYTAVEDGEGNVLFAIPSVFREAVKDDLLAATLATVYNRGHEAGLRTGLLRKRNELLSVLDLPWETTK